MKSVAWLLFSLWFTLLSAGININAHWCGSKVAHIALFGKKAKACKCSSKKAKKDKSCCSNSSSYYKITDKYTATSETEPPVVYTTFTLTSFSLAEVISLVRASEVSDHFSWKPPPDFTPIYLRLQQFRT